MEYQTLYRRWRPRVFADFVGQSHIVTTLSNAIATGRVAHAYLFTGPRGTGKTSVAKIFAKALNCSSLQGAEPCDQCDNCRRINEGNLMDVIEIDAASNRGIDEIRDLREKVKFAPAEGRNKIYIIDEVHMLTSEAFNALLKTLEEPPSFVVFILATTEVHKIPATILSRCQRFDFKRFTVGEIKGRLGQILQSEQVSAAEDALELIAEHAEGGMRDAVSLLEQSLAHCDGRLEIANVRAILGLIDQEEMDKITTALQENNTKTALDILEQVNLAGKDLFQFGRSLIGHFRQLLLTSLSGQTAAAEFSPGELIRIIETLAAATHEVKKSQQSALPLELAFIKLTALRQDPSDMESRLAKLESLVGDGAIKVAALHPEQRAVQTNPLLAAQTVQKEKQPSDGAPPDPAATEPAKHPPKTDGGGILKGFTWEAFLEKVKQRKRTLAALIQEGKLLQVNGNELVVGVPPNLKFHLENLTLAANREILESILREWLASDIGIRCIPLPAEGKPVVEEAQPAQPPDLVAKTIAIFGGEARPINKEEERK